jgi:hypothetical protein
MAESNPHTEDRVSAMGLHRFADDFYQAYMLLTDQRNNALQVRYFLLCRSLELAFKALLRQHGYSVKQLQDIGHNLNNLLIEVVKTCGYKPKPEDTALIKLANQHYETKEMEYFTRGYKEFPDINVLADYVGIQIRIIHIEIFKHAKKEGQDTPRY